MAAEEDEEKEKGRSFRVEDRRRFSLETGEPRAAESPEQTTASVVSEETQPSFTLRSGTAQTAPPSPEMSFPDFILGLSTQALMFMGEIPPIPGESVQVDLSAAQQMIDVLAMLQQKTRGNLDGGEEAMLKNILFDLRMRYVDLVKASRDATHKKQQL